MSKLNKGYSQTWNFGWKAKKITQTGKYVTKYYLH